MKPVFWCVLSVLSLSAREAQLSPFSKEIPKDIQPAQPAADENVPLDSEDTHQYSLNPKFGEVAPQRRNQSEPYSEILDMVPAGFSLGSSRSLYGEHVNLYWVSWNRLQSRAPSNAVSIWNSYTGRRDYVCQSGCSAGFYSPSKGGYCHYPYDGKEWVASYFEVLVNKDEFEPLDWRADSWGDVPPHSVATCYSRSSFVGKNEYGLGKVVPGHGSFFLPYEGSEYWYKYYDVLYINKQGYSQSLSNVQYNTPSSEDSRELTLASSTVENLSCQTVNQIVAMEYSFTKENTWSMERSSTEVTSTSITAEIPFIGVGGGVEFSKQVTQSVILGKTISETKSYTSSVEVPIPPSYSCMVHLSASHKKVNVPYTATLTRYYSHYPTKSTSVIGTFKGANAFDIRVVIERCQPLNQSTPCMTAQ